MIQVPRRTAPKTSPRQIAFFNMLRSAQVETAGSHASQFLSQRVPAAQSVELRWLRRPSVGCVSSKPVASRSVVSRGVALVPVALRRERSLKDVLLGHFLRLRRAAQASRFERIAERLGALGKSRPSQSVASKWRWSGAAFQSQSERVASVASCRSELRCKSVLLPWGVSDCTEGDALSQVESSWLALRSVVSTVLSDLSSARASNSEATSSSPPPAKPVKG